MCNVARDSSISPRGLGCRGGCSTRRRRSRRGVREYGSCSSWAFRQVKLASWQFTDPRLPLGYVPFNTQALDGRIFVTYDKPDRATHREGIGADVGVVDEFSTDGHRHGDTQLDPARNGRRVPRPPRRGHSRARRRPPRLGRLPGAPDPPRWHVAWSLPRDTQGGAASRVAWRPAWLNGVHNRRGGGSGAFIGCRLPVDLSDVRWQRQRART